MSYLNTDRLKQTGFILLILSVGAVLFWKFFDFLPGFLGALTLYVVMRPALIFLVKRRKWRKTPTAVLLMIVSFIVFLVPIGLFVNMTYGKIGLVMKNSGNILESVQQMAEKIRLSTSLDVLSDVNIQKAQDALANFLPRFLGSTFNVLTTIAVMYFFLYFMLTQFEEMENSLYEYTPLKEKNVLKLGREVNSMVFSNAVGIPLLGIVQAGCGILGYWIFGIKDLWFWGVITGFMSILPVVGTGIVWLPLSIFLIADGKTWQGIGLALYGVLIIGNMDNVFRFMWQKKMADVHPLITVFGVLIGINLFGFIGIIFGPLLISLFILLLKIYGDEFTIRKRSVQIVTDKPETE
ncbi:AI-2E family transporter [Compostibacter hankyongensis]|uniref:AI-2E family transporter n=1 Tax=Compostibacter hankyongensis TaxID=1007089 RepID=A0ABP8FCR6_9BACT